MKLDKSLFAGEEIIERKVKLSDGKEHVLYFKELPAIEFRRFHMANSSGDEKRQLEAMGNLIAASLVDPDGTQAITIEDALRLKTKAMQAISAVVMEINGLGKDFAKKA